MDVDVDAYLDRIGHVGSVSVDLTTLSTLQRAHMTTVPFETLDVFHGRGVRNDLAWSLPKIVDRRRGGWCFENNGAFGALLEAIGFDVTLLGAAVLLRGPNDVIDHLTLEVRLDRSYLVDVGFGSTGPIVPLAINERTPQDGLSGVFEFIPSPKGLTLTMHDDAGVPTPQYRFKRVALTLADFDAVSARLQHHDASPFLAGPLAHRLLDGGPDRVSLTTDRLRVVRRGETLDRPVAPDDWSKVLHEWFDIAVEDHDDR